MKRQKYFKYGLTSSLMIFITIYSYFWYTAGLFGLSTSIQNNLFGLFILFVLACSSFIASRSQYLERKHSIIFSLVYSIPTLAFILVYMLSDSGIAEFDIFFASFTLILFTQSSGIYILSIFIKE